MADSSNKRIWLDKSGKVLVDKEGNPFYTDSCCCGSDSVCCWQYYEASCVDSDGAPVYGTSGTFKTSQNTWTDGSMVRYECASCTIAGRLPGAWELDSPGTAHLWLSTGPASSSQCEDNCSVPVYVGKPSIPCSCTSISFSSTVNRLPYMNVAFPCACSLVWTKTTQGSSLVSSSYTPAWEFAVQAVGSYDAANPAAPWTTYTKSTRQAAWYLGNLVSGCLEQPGFFSPKYQLDENGSIVRDSNGSGLLNPEYEAWSSSRFQQEYYTYEVVSDAAGGMLYPVLGASGKDIWANADRWIQWNSETQAGAGPWYLSTFVNDAGVTLFGPCSNSTTPYGELGLYSTVSMYMCHQPNRWKFLFDDSQWGHAEVTPSATDGTYLHVVREARGAAVPAQDVPVSASLCTMGAANRLEGSPRFFYRFFVTTDFPVDELNASNWEYLTFKASSSVDPSRATWSLSALGGQGLFCPVYWGIYYTAQLPPPCSADPPQKFPFTAAAGYLSSVYVAQSAYTCSSVAASDSWEDPRGCPGVKYTAVAAANENFVQPREWQHESEESVDAFGNPLTVPGLRAFSSAVDFHAYAVLPLGIQNYPTWYRNPDNAIKPLDATRWETPRMDYSEEVQSCSCCSGAQNLPSGATSQESSAAWDACESSCSYPEKPYRVLAYTVPHAIGSTVLDSTGPNAFASLSGEWGSAQQPERLGAAYAPAGNPVQLLDYKDIQEDQESGDLWYDKRALEDAVEGCPDYDVEFVPYCGFTVQSYCTVFEGENNATSRKVYGPVETSAYMGSYGNTPVERFVSQHGDGCLGNSLNWGGHVHQSCSAVVVSSKAFPIDVSEEEDSQDSSQGRIVHLLSRGILAYQCMDVCGSGTRWNNVAELAAGYVTGEPVRDPSKPRSNDPREYSSGGAFEGLTPPSYTVDIVWGAEYSRYTDYNYNQVDWGSTAVTVSGVKGYVETPSSTTVAGSSQLYNSYRGSRTYRVEYDTMMHAYTSTLVLSSDTCSAYASSSHDRYTSRTWKSPVSVYHWGEEVHYSRLATSCNASLTPPAVGLSANLAGSRKYAITSPPNCNAVDAVGTDTGSGTRLVAWADSSAYVSSSVVASWVTTSGSSSYSYNSNPDKPATWSLQVPGSKYTANFDPHENPWGNGNGSGGGQFCASNLDSVASPGGPYTGADSRKGSIEESGDDSTASYSRYYSWGGSNSTSYSTDFAVMGAPWSYTTVSRTSEDKGYCSVYASFSITYDESPADNADTGDI